MRSLPKSYWLLSLIALVLVIYGLSKWLTSESSDKPRLAAAHQVQSHSLQLDNGLRVTLNHSSTNHGAIHWHQAQLNTSDSLEWLPFKQAAIALGGELLLWPGNHNQALSLTFSQGQTAGALELISDLIDQQPNIFPSRNHLVIVSELDIDQQLEMLPNSLMRLSARESQTQPMSAASNNHLDLFVHLPIHLDAHEQAFVWWWLKRPEQPSNSWINNQSLYWSTEQQWHLQWRWQRSGKAVADLLQSLVNLESHLDLALAEYQHQQSLCLQHKQAHHALHQAMLISGTQQPWRTELCQIPQKQSLERKLAQLQPERIQIQSFMPVDQQLPVLSAQDFSPFNAGLSDEAPVLSQRSSNLLRVQPQLTDQQANYRLWFSQNEFATNDFGSLYLGWPINNLDEQQTAWWLVQILNHQAIELRQQFGLSGLGMRSELVHGHLSILLEGPSEALLLAQQLLHDFLFSDLPSHELNKLTQSQPLSSEQWLALERQQPRQSNKPESAQWRNNYQAFLRTNPMKQLWFADLQSEQVKQAASIWLQEQQVQQPKHSFPLHQDLKRSWFYSESQPTNSLSFWQFSDSIEQQSNRQLLFQLMQKEMQNQWRQQGLEIKVRGIATDNSSGIVLTGDATHLLEARMNRFIENYWQQLQDMPSRQYNNLQQGQALRLLHQPWSNELRAEQFWHSLLLNDPHFLRHIKRSEQMTLVSKDSLVRHLGSLRRVENTGLWLHQGTTNLEQHRGNRSRPDRIEDLFN